MSHLEEVSARVDAAIAESVIAHMNELLIALSDDAELRREDRYVQQQRLRTAIAHHGRQYQKSGRAPRTASPKAAQSCNPLKLALRNQPCANDQQQRAKRRPDHCA